MRVALSVVLYVYKYIKYNSTSPSAAMMAICLQYVPAKKTIWKLDIDRHVFNAYNISHTLQKSILTTKQTS